MKEGVMNMSNERAGDQVFTNIDRVLAEKIISRSRENSGAAEPVFDGAAYAHRLSSRQDGNLPPDGKSIPVIRTVAAILAILFLVMWIFRRGKSE
jgi:hypothetical protein